MSAVPLPTPAASGDRPSSTPLIFVLGGARSGTTLLGRILGAHPQVLRLGETHFFESVWAVEEQAPGAGAGERMADAARATLRLFERYGYSEGQHAVESSLTEQSLLEWADALGGGTLGLYRAFAQRLVQSAGRTIFCDDTPRHVFYLDTILGLLPEARVVACLRDPRDYLASYKFHWRRAREPERVKAIYHPVITSILWRSTWLAAARSRAPDAQSRVILNRYEDLVTQPEDQTRRLCRFLDLGFDPGMLSIDGSNSSFGDAARGVFTSSVGRFREALTPEEIWICQWITAAGMRQLSYLPEPCRPNPFKLGLLAMTTVPGLLRGLHANRRRRGALIPYLWRRLRGLFQ